MSKHTPGPWMAEKDEHDPNGEFIIWGGDEEYIGAISTPYDDPDLALKYMPRLEADARLIAAAPELLVMLKMAQLWLDVDGRFDMRGINAAIAKAEGK